jgi:hypothetical protein
MFSRTGFLGQARWNGTFQRSMLVPYRLTGRQAYPPVRLGGMVEDYQNEINTLKEKLQSLSAPGPGWWNQPSTPTPPPPPPGPVPPGRPYTPGGPPVYPGVASGYGTPSGPPPKPGPAPEAIACYSCSGVSPEMLTKREGATRGCVETDETNCRPPVPTESRIESRYGPQSMIPSGGEGGAMTPGFQGTIPFSTMTPGFQGTVPFGGEGGAMTTSFPGSVPFGGEGGGMAPGFQQGAVPFGGEGGGGDIRAPGGGIPIGLPGGGGMVPSGASLTGRRVYRVVNRRP